MECPSCGAAPLERVLDLTDSQTSFWRCLACGSYPVCPAPPNPTYLYTEKYFEGGVHSKSPRYSGYLSYDGDRGVMRRDFIELFKPFVHGAKRVLDIGCATGTALEAFRELGVPEDCLSGIDVSEYAISVARRNLPLAQLRAEDATSADLGGPYDLIALLDVLEHVENPTALMKKAIQALTPGGKIIVSTPDPESFARRIFGARWSEFHAGEHICFVGASWFSWIARSHDLRVLALRHHGKRVTLEHALSRLRAYVPFFPLAKIRHILNLNTRDRLFAVLEKPNFSVTATEESGDERRNPLHGRIPSLRCCFGRNDKRSKLKIKRVVLPIIFATAIGVIMSASILFFRNPILSPVTQDGAWYHAVVKEAIEGGSPWNAVLAEGKAYPYPVPDLAEKIMAIPGRILGMEAQSVLLFWRFVLIAFLAFVIYCVTERLESSRGLAFFAAGTSVFFAPFLYSLAHPIMALLGLSPSMPFTIYDRPVHPQFEAPFIWLFLYFATSAMLEPKKKRNAVIAGLVLGLLAHTYFWAWTFCVSALAVLALIAIVSRSRIVISRVAIAATLGLLIAAPKIVSLVRFTFFGNDSSYAERMAAYSVHLFASWTFNLPVVLALALFIWRRRFASLWVRTFVSAGLGGSFIALNQQVVTGISIQPDHYVQLITASFSLWVFVWIAWTFMRSWRPIALRMAVIAALIIGVASAFIFQYRSYVAHREYTEDLQPFSEIATWLNANAAPQSVVFANQQTGLLVPIYTNQNLWWHFYALAVPSSRERIEHAAFTWFRLFGVEPQNLRLLAERQPVDFSQYFTLSTIYEQRIDFINRNIEGIVSRYRKFTNEKTIPEALREYRVDYVLVDKKLDTWDYRELGVGDALIENGRFALYPAR